MRRLAIPALTLALLPALSGCPPMQPAGKTGDGAAQFLDSATNSSFATATPLTLAADGTLRFTGSIADGGDIDLYNLGQLSAGDEARVDVQATGGNLDAVVALFDKRQFLQGFNDDRVPDASNLNPLLNIVVRGPEGDYFIGIAALPGSGTSGAYEVKLSITRGAGVPDPKPQIVFLDWRGGPNVTVPNVGTFDLTPFDAGDLGPFGNSTVEIKKRVQELVRADYGGLNLILLNSDDNAIPTAEHSTVYFGGNNRRAFAISEQVDSFNKDQTDDSIVFTRSYNLAFSKTPSVEEISQALANTVSHEIGHLLGLVHTASCDDLMDSTCSNDRLLEPQSFTVAVLDPLVFPLGFQDANEFLRWTLGLVGL